jgi:hypothetical protein
MKRVLQYALLTLAAALVGFPLGFRHARNSIGDGAAMLSQTLALSEYETLANLQFKQADAQHGSQAQLDLLSFMQQLQASQKIAVPRALDYDRARVFMRLAMLEKQAGDHDKFQQYLRQAQQSLSRADHKWYTEDKMRKFIEEADSQSQY